MSSGDGSGTGPLDTIPLFDVKIPLTPARAAAIRRALAALDAIPAQRRELDRHEALARALMPPSRTRTQQP
jgi:hypothetical protein